MSGLYMIQCFNAGCCDIYAVVMNLIVGKWNGHENRVAACVLLLDGNRCRGRNVSRQGELRLVSQCAAMPFECR
jgi:hypothetical protein